MKSRGSHRLAWKSHHGPEHMLHHYFWCSKQVNVFFWSLASFAVISLPWIKHLRTSTTYSCKWEGYISIADASILRASIYFRRNVLELAVSTSLNTLSFFLANLHPSVFAIILPFFFELPALIKLRSTCRSRAIRFVSSCLIGIKRCHKIHPTKCLRLMFLRNYSFVSFV